MYVDENTTKQVLYCPESKNMTAGMLLCAIRRIREDVNPATMYFFALAMMQTLNLYIMYCRFSSQKHANDAVIATSRFGEDAAYVFLTVRERLKYNPYQYKDIISAIVKMVDCDAVVRALELDDETVEFLRSDEFIMELEKIVIS